MNYKIVVDSSADLLALDGVAFASAPLKIQAGEREFVDNAELDVAGMVEYLKQIGRASCRERVFRPV